MKLSIIVPIYNAEQYLEECLESVVNQSYREKEIILVDDGSTDASGAICDAYACRYGFVAVLHGTNRGLSGARNIGMDTATGECIAFVDADDVLDRDAYEILMQALQKTESDVSACGFCIEYGSIAAAGKQDTVPRPFVAEGMEACLLSISAKEHCLTGFAWNKVYRRKVIGGIRFKEDAVLCEDLVFNYEVLSNAKRVCMTDLPMYHWRYMRASLSRNSRLDRYRKCLDSRMKLNAWVEENAPFCKEGVYTDFIFWNTKVSEQMLKNPDMELYELVKTNLIRYKTYIPGCSVRVRLLAYSLLRSWQSYRILGALIYQCKLLYIRLQKLKKKVM